MVLGPGGGVRATPVRTHRILTLPFDSQRGSFDTRALDELQQRAVLLECREQLFEAQGMPFLLCVCVLATAAATVPSTPAASVAIASPFALTPEPDPELIAETLNAEPLSFEAKANFEKLRAWRNATARRQGVPPYVLLTNRQLRDLAARRPGTVDALREIAGIGPKKVENYGPALLAILHPGSAPQLVRPSATALADAPAAEPVAS